MWQEIKQHRKLFLNLIFINMFMGYTAFYFGVDFVSGAISSIIMGMTPLINVLLAHLLASNDKLNGYKNRQPHHQPCRPLADCRDGQRR